MASSRPWPFDDDDDRPSGSVRPLSQADLQAILAHLSDDEPNQLLAGTSADRPVVVVRVWASVGRPGGSAQARWRLQAAEWVTWTGTLPWRLAASLGIGAAGGLLGNLIQPKMSLIVGGLAAMAAGWALRFRPAPRPAPGGAGRRGRCAPLGCSTRWSGRGGRSCTTWPSRVARPISTAMIPSAAVAVRSDPNIDRPGCLQSGSVDRCCGRRMAPTSRANVTS
jgi:hypothetical protein